MSINIKKLAAVILSAICFFSFNASYANSDDKFIGWTEEQYQQYGDSLLTALYPKPVLHRDTTYTGNNSARPQKRKAKSQNNHVPMTVAIDKTKGVGQIPINSSASFGAKTYEIPISIPSGINEFQPNISLTYNSYQGNSVTGQGWALSGIPIITRGGKSIYYDGKAEGVAMSNSDSFTLDGTRLIKTGTYAGYIMYESEQGNIKVKGYYSGDIIKYFEVFFPDGYKGIFGSSYNSTNQVYYPLVLMSDLKGNKIYYSYSHNDNHYTIDEITYNGSSIKFNYTSRTDTILSYSGGLKIAETKLLKSISPKFNGNTLSTYSFTYTTQNARSYLTQVDYTANGQSLNPLRFYYGEGNTDSSFLQSTTRLVEWYDTAKPGKVRVSRGKFDYDKSVDGLIMLPDQPSYWHYYRKATTFSHSKNIFVNKYTGDEEILLFIGMNDEWAYPLSHLYTEKGFIDLLCADLDGNQDEYIIKINNEVVNNVDRVTFKIYKVKYVLEDSPQIFFVYTRTYDFQTVYTDAAGNKSVQPKFYYTGDFNGDGKIDIMAVSVHEPFGEKKRPSNCYIFDLLGDKILYQGNVLPYNYEFVGDKQADPYEASDNSDKLFVLDYDGDGKSDICHIDKNGINVYTFDITGTTMTPRKVATDSGITRSSAKDRYILLGEFNGDGKTDLLLSPAWSDQSGITGYRWGMYMSNGLGSFQKTTFEGESVTTPKNGSGDVFITQDINGDGTSDLIMGSIYGVSAYLDQYNTIQRFSSANAKFSSKDAILIPTDINSHNTYTHIMSVNDSIVTKYAFSRDDHKEGLLTGMANSFGVVERNEYNYINDEGVLDEVYVQGYDAVFPYVNLLEPMTVLTHTETLLNGEAVDWDSYVYHNGVINRQGLGFCGFEKIIRGDRKGQEHTQTFDPYKFCTLKSETSPSFERQYNYSVSTESNKIAKIRLKSQSENDLLKGITTNIAYTYDSYGYPIREVKTFSDDITVTTTATYAHQSDVQDGYNLGFNTSHTVSTVMNNSVYTKQEKVISYEGRLPLKTNSYVNGSLVNLRILGHDKKGNKIADGDLPYSSTQLILTRYTYDDYGHIIKTIDPLDRITEYTYNNLGQRESEKDFRGQTATFEYDAFGRQTTVNHPDETISEIQYNWSDEGSGALISVTKTKTGQPTETSVYDALGHEISTRVNLFDNTIQKVDKVYDYDGNLQKQSLPYKGSAPTLWVTYAYDIFDRLLSVTEPSGRKNIHAYDGNSVTTTADKIATKKDYDALGNVISVTDPGGTIYYNLNADGQPEDIVAPGDITTSFTYDVYRRKTKLSDPSAGNILYEYDNQGNIAKTTNANGKVTQTEYDKYNRLVKKTTPEIVTTYNYDVNGDMTAMVSDNGSSKTYVYDDYGRLKSETETSVGGRLLTKEYTYSKGNITTIRYLTKTGLLASESHLYTNGYLSKININGINIKGSTIIFDLLEQNDFGKPTKVKTGNITREYQYTPYGLPSARKSYYGSRTYQNVSYGFNPTNRCLMLRTDVSRNITENFQYDALNRLTYYGPSTAKYRAEYDAKGNITNKSDVGDFEYSLTQKPYAISSLTPSGSAVTIGNQEVGYTSFSRPSYIFENGHRANFYYNGDDERCRMDILRNDTLQYSTHYLGGCYEVQTGSSVAERLYLAGDYYSAPAVLVKVGTVTNLVYIIRDYLGSITHIVSGTNSTLIQETSYDAWGRLRNPGNQKCYNPESVPGLFLGRGYTGHEHLPMFGLINMNARLYDPALGRFLAPDPYVQMPDFSQNFNRYSYALNNPLCYIDEDGQFFWAVVGIAAGVSAIINVATHWKEIKSAGGWNGFWKGASYFLTGAAAGGIGAAAGYFVAPILGGAAGLSATGFFHGAATGAITGAADGLILGAGNSLLAGNNLGRALTNGLYQSATGFVVGGIGGGILDGIRAVIKGREFLTGKIKTETLCQRAADMAENNISETRALGGTKKHQYAEEAIKRYQKIHREQLGDLQLSIEKTITDDSGATFRPDIVDYKNKFIYDFKFGYPNKTPTMLNNTYQMQKYREILGFPSKVIKPRIYTSL